MFTRQQIAEAKATAAVANGFHQHDDCILIACQWLDAQKRVKKPNQQSWSRPLKHIIESWAGRYVSSDDVTVAAHLLGLKGTYPRFNISTRFTLPSTRRLEGIGEAMRHQSYRENHDINTYARIEQ